MATSRSFSSVAPKIWNALPGHLSSIPNPPPPPPRFFIQWNCRGLRANLTDLKVILEEHQPTAVCLQETLLSKPGLFKLRGFKSYDIFSDADGSSRSVSILANISIPTNSNSNKNQTPCGSHQNLSFQNHHSLFCIFPL